MINQDHIRNVRYTYRPQSLITQEHIRNVDIMADGSQDMSLVTYTEMPAVVNHEEVFSIVNYNVSDEIDEGYSTNYSPSSKSTSSFECLPLIVTLTFC